jgi:molybdopterin molybdotransferase
LNSTPNNERAAAKSHGIPRDVRMHGFSERVTVDEATGWIDARIHAQGKVLGPEPVAPVDARGRVLAEAVSSRIDVPSFSRAMMDGFAVRAGDTLGASAYNRLPLRVIAESLPGRGTSVEVTERTAVRIMTGAPLPSGADAVIPVEVVEIEEDQVLVLDAVPPGKHVGLPGEDIRIGTTVLPQGRILRPQDVGVLVSIGVASIQVVRRPRVRIVVTGNELLAPGAVPSGCQIIDSNSPMLRALIERDGGVVLNPGIVADDPDEVLTALRTDADVIVVSGGSSVGQEDYAPPLVAREGELAIHGVAMRPSSPVGMGTLGNRLVFLLPGNPVSCLCAYDFFAGRAIRLLGGRQRDWPYSRRRLTLARKLVSTVGRVDYARVQIQADRVEPLAISGASVLSSTTRADGFVVVPSDSEGYPAGAAVDVFLYDLPVF